MAKSPATASVAADAALDRFVFVTNQARADLRRFADLVEEWNRVHNLLSNQPGDLWTRHIADSLQLVDRLPGGFRTWVDLGSGAGFPGLIVAIANRKKPERRFILVESNHKKAAFLRTAIRELSVNAAVAAQRIEEHAKTMPGAADVVSARALAPMAAVCRLAHPYMHPDSTMLLLKGQGLVQEMHEASKSWEFDVLTSPSVTDPSGTVLALRNLRAKHEHASA